MEKCFRKKGHLGQLFSTLKVLLANNFQLHSHYSLSYKIFVHFISKTLDLEQMRMGWIRNNSLGKKYLTEKIFKRQFSVALIDSILTIFIITMKITNKSKIKQKSGKICHIYHMNAQNATYLISYLGFCF